MARRTGTRSGRSSRPNRSAQPAGLGSASTSQATGPTMTVGGRRWQPGASNNDTIIKYLNRFIFGVLAQGSPLDQAKEAGDQLATVDDLDRSTLRADVFLGRFDLETVAEARHEVRDGDRVVLHGGPVGGGRANDLASFDPAAGEGNAKNAGEVVAAGVRVDLGGPGQTRPSRSPASGRASLVV